MRKIVISSIAIILFCSCGSQKVLFTKRYAKQTVIKSFPTIKDSIAIGTFILNPEKETPPKVTTIADLTDKGQAALLTELAKKEAKTEDFINAAGSKIQAKSKANEETILDYTKITKQVVVNIQNKTHSPANRISKITAYVDLSSSDSNIKLISCDKLVTTFATLDLGKINYSNVSTAELTGTASLGAGAEKTEVDGSDTTKITSSNGLSATGKLSSTKTLAEEVLLKQRLVTLNTSIEGNKLSLYQEGTTGIDLTGNLIANITFEVKDVAVKNIYSFSELRAADKSFNDPKKININSVLLAYPNLTKGINAVIGYDADLRYVEKNGETIVESDDEVKLCSGTFTAANSVELVSIDKLRPKLWKIARSDDQAFAPVQIQSTQSLQAGDLLFNSRENAILFLQWLKSKYVVNTNNNIKIVNDEYQITMPAGFTDIKKLEIFPY